MTTKHDADRAAAMFRHGVDLMDGATGPDDLITARTAILEAMTTLVEVVRLGDGYLTLIDIEIGDSRP